MMHGAQRLVRGLPSASMNRRRISAFAIARSCVSRFINACAALPLRNSSPNDHRRSVDSNTPRPVWFAPLYAPRTVLYVTIPYTVPPSRRGRAGGGPMQRANCLPTLVLISPRAVSRRNGTVGTAQYSTSAPAPAPASWSERSGTQDTWRRAHKAQQIVFGMRLVLKDKKKKKKDTQVAERITDKR